MQTIDKKPDSQAGFTLVEVMVTMVIIGLLATFVIINVMPSQEKARTQKAKGDIRLIEQALEMYRLDMYDYPSQDQGLQALVSLPSGSANADRYPKNGFVKFLPDDPWGRPYQYRFPGEHGEVDIFSYGADGKPGGEGRNADIVNWKK